MKNKRGFTIIELVVVIAIIAVLAALILSNVAQYNKKGKDSALKGQISQIRSAGTDFFSSKGTYANMCDPGTGCARIEANIIKLGGFQGDNANVTNSTYCLDFKLSDGVTLWCVDNKGYVGPIDNCANSPYSCSGS